MPRFGPDVVLDDPAYIHETALVYGNVRIGKGASLWPYAVIRCENHAIEIGPYTNLQEHSTIHTGGGMGTKIGAWCSIAHHVCVHGATIGDNVLIGINATIMDGAVIGDNCIIGGHTIVTERTVIPPNSVVMGSPGKVVRTADNFERTHRNGLIYWNNALAYARGEHRAWADPALDAWVDAEMAKARAARKAAAA